MKPGLYDGRVRIDGGAPGRTFAQGITIKSEVTYQARLRHDEAVVICYYGKGITLEGFEIAHSAPVVSGLVVQIQHLRGSRAGCDDGDCVSRITLRNNITHDSLDNDLVKIKNGADEVTVEGGKTLPWSVVRDLIEGALRTRLIERAVDSGPWPCDFAGAQSVRLRLPSFEAPPPPPPEPLRPGIRIAEAELKPNQIQDLADVIGEVAAARQPPDMSSRSGSGLPLEARRRRLSQFSPRSTRSWERFRKT